MDCVDCMEIAFNNLLLLSNKSKTSKDFENIIIVGCELKTMEGNDNYDAIFSLQELEYPVLLTFERILFFIEYSYKCKYQNYTKQELMHLCDYVIDILLYYVDICNEDNKNEHLFNSLLDDIIEKYNLLNIKRDTVYFRVSEKLSALLDSFSETLLESGQYLYLSKPPRFTIQEYESDDDDEESDECDDDEESEECDCDDDECDDDECEECDDEECDDDECEECEECDDDECGDECDKDR